MSETKKIKYLSKTVRFGPKQVTLYSIDGHTWSTRKEELVEIIERHESEKMTFGEIRGQLPGNKPIAPKKAPPEKYKFRPGLQKAEQRRTAAYAARGLEIPKINREVLAEQDGELDPKVKQFKLDPKAAKALKAKSQEAKKAAAAAKKQPAKTQPLAKKRASAKPVKKAQAKPKAKKRAA